MVTWMCDVKLTRRLPSTELRERLELEDVASSIAVISYDGMVMCFGWMTTSG